MDAVDDKTLIRRTLLTVAAMVGACVLIVGSISLFVVLVVGRAASSPQGDERTQVNAPTPTPEPRGTAQPPKPQTKRTAKISAAIRLAISP